LVCTVLISFKKAPVKFQESTLFTGCRANKILAGTHTYFSTEKQKTRNNNIEKNNDKTKKNLKPAG